MHFLSNLDTRKSKHMISSNVYEVRIQNVMDKFRIREIEANVEKLKLKLLSSQQETFKCNNK